MKVRWSRHARVTSSRQGSSSASAWVFAIEGLRHLVAEYGASQIVMGTLTSALRFVLVALAVATPAAGPRCSRRCRS